jgi:large subunit ribosomal protein L9
MGDVVKVRNGYARNFLLPQKKALRANEANKQVFEAQREELETRNIERRNDAAAAAKKLDGQSFIVIRQASDTGLLFGSVSTRDIAEAAASVGVKVERNQVRLEKPIKTLGVAKVRIMLHPEVPSSVEINVARSKDEAERQARGENVLIREEDITKEQPAETAEFYDAEKEVQSGEEAESAS